MDIYSSCAGASETHANSVGDVIRKTRAHFTAIYTPVLCRFPPENSIRPCILKTFCPEPLLPHTDYNPRRGVYTLKPSAHYLSHEWNLLRNRFHDELELNMEVNLNSGGLNPVFPLIPIRERDDMLMIDTGSSLSVDEFVKAFRPDRMTAAYLRLALTMTKRLTAAVAAVHRTCLHLDITPQSVYIDLQGDLSDPKTAQSDFPVRLLDLSAARRNHDGCIHQKIGCMYTEGYSDVRLKGTAPCIADECCDLFSIAAVLFFLLTGDSPRTDCETFYAPLPCQGPLSCELKRQKLEDLISAALQLHPRFDCADLSLEEFSRELDDIMNSFFSKQDSVI